MRPSHRDLLIAYWMLFDEIDVTDRDPPAQDSGGKPSVDEGKPESEQGSGGGS